jgi:hypothetical protein
MENVDFEFEIFPNNTINLMYVYGGERFTFNLYETDGQWLLHPFDSSLLGNKEICQLVVADLLKNKAFQVLLAKERISPSQIYTSINLQEEDTVPLLRENRLQRNPGPPLVQTDPNDVDEFIDTHTIDDILMEESNHCQTKIKFYNDILQRMFMEGSGPHDREFQKVQDIVRAYNDALSKIMSIRR